MLECCLEIGLIINFTASQQPFLFVNTFCELPPHLFVTEDPAEKIFEDNGTPWAQTSTKNWYSAPFFVSDYNIYFSLIESVGTSSTSLCYISLFLECLVMQITSEQAYEELNSWADDNH